MIPLFKTHYSIGQSILRPRQCFELAKSAGLTEIFFVEDYFLAFRTLDKLSKEFNIPLRFGVRIEAMLESNPSKIVLFAKNGEGVRALRHIFTETHADLNGVWVLQEEKLKDIQVAVPFYGGFPHKNLHYFGVHDFIGVDTKDWWFFEEDNNHPYDYQIKRALNGCDGERVLAKTILYDRKKDFMEYQFLRSVCSRTGGKSPTFGNPNLEMCGSDEFCWESYEKR